MCCKLAMRGVTLQLELEQILWAARSSTGEILQRLRGHGEYVCGITFAAGWEKIVSGFWDWKAMIWE